MDEKLKKAYEGRLFQPIHDVFYSPYAYNKCTPYGNRIQSDFNSYMERGLERQVSEKFIYEESNETEFDISLSSSDSKAQLPCLKTKSKSKRVGLPYEMEIKRNKKFIKMNKIRTACNWFPNVFPAPKIEEIIKPALNISRPATCSNPNKRNQSSKATPVVAAQSINEGKGDIPITSRCVSKSKRVILKNKPKNDEKMMEFEGGYRSADNFKDFIDKKKEIERMKLIEENRSKKEIIALSDGVFEEFKKTATEDVKIPTEKKHKKRKSEKKDIKVEIKIEKREKKESKDKAAHKDHKDQAENKPKIEKPKKAMPPTVSEIVGKHRNYNLNQLLNNKNSDFKSLMQEYLRRSGLNENTKIFIIQGPYDFFRKVLISKGWCENTHSTSQAFDLKWAFNDNESDYKLLKPGQFYNHFPGNRELTTKSGLLKNLRNVTDYELNTDTFYPRSYDLGDTTQVQEFQKDYMRTSSFNIIKYFSGLFESCISQTIPIDILLLTLKVVEKSLKIIQDNCETAENDWEFPDSVWKQILEFSEHGIPLKDHGDDWDYPEESVCIRTIKAKKCIEMLFPQAKMEGVKNVWIVKPGLNARGSGVKCMQGLESILECGLHLQARVVQKYIERPLLINNSKFDIRQWVLVTSFEPLTVYFFNNCYLRLCQLPFNLDSLEAYRHLANYSLQKNIAKNQEETVWSLSRFIEYLNIFSVHWEDILQNIHKLVIQTLHSVHDSIESRPECFEIYGFDILLDDTYCPWLLEVNLSPACSERTDWLSEMLVKMASGLVQILFEPNDGTPLYGTDLKLQGLVKGDSNEWVFLYRGEELPCGDQENFAYGNLEICGEKVNVRKEKNYDKKYLLGKAAVVVQRHVRGHLVREKLRKDKENCIALGIQRLFRKFLAFENIEKQVRLVSCVKIQCNFRRYLAKKAMMYLKKLKMIRYIQAHMKGLYQRKDFKAIKTKRAALNIQKALRRKIAIGKVRHEKLMKKSTLIIQKHWKNRWRKLNSSAQKIQKYWKIVYKHKKNSATKIQKLVRGYKARQKYQKVKQIKLRVILIQNAIKSYMAYKDIIDRKILKGLSCLEKLQKYRKIIRLSIYIKVLKNIVKIQANFRRHQCENQYKKRILYEREQKRAVETMQKHLKGFLGRKNYMMIIKNQAAKTIQRFYKGYNARKYFNLLIILNESAKIIQRAYRKYKSRRRIQMQLRIREQEIERRKRLERLKREQEIRAIKISERLHNNNSYLRPSLKMQQNTVLEEKTEKIDKIEKAKRKKSKKKYKFAKDDQQMKEEVVHSLPRVQTQEGKKMKKVTIKVSPKDAYGVFM